MEQPYTDTDTKTAAFLDRHRLYLSQEVRGLLGKSDELGVRGAIANASG
jgi:hypothetical protein